MLELHVTGAVRQGMAAHRNDIKAGAEVSGLGRHSYGLVRRLLILRDVYPLTPAEKGRVDATLASIDRTGQVATYAHDVNDLVSKYIPSRRAIRAEKTRAALRQERKASKRLENTLFRIRDACANNDEMVIPAMSSQQREEAISILTDSARFALDLVYRIRESSHD